MGPDWRGYQDIDPVILTRETIIEFCNDVDTQAIRDIFPCGTPQQVAEKIKGFCDAGMRVFKVMDYGGMAGLQVRRELGRQGARDRGRTAAPGGGAMSATASAPRRRRAAGPGPSRDRASPTGATPRLPERFAARGRAHQRASRWTPRARAGRGGTCHWLLTDRLKFFDDRKRYPHRRRGDRPADVRHRRAALGHHADACADVGRSRRARAALLGSHAPLAAARHRRGPTIRAARRPTTTGARSTPRCRSGCTAIPTTTCSATACPRTSAPGPSTSG